MEKFGKGMRSEYKAGARKRQRTERENTIGNFGTLNTSKYVQLPKYDLSLYESKNRKMGKRILCALASVVLFALPWLGGSALTLFVAFVPLLCIERDLCGKTGKKGRPLRFWPYPVLVFALWWLATVWWVGFAAVIGVAAATLVGTVLMAGVFLIYHAVARRAPRPLAYTVLVAGWLAYEWLYLHGEISFPWLVLGNGFARDIRLVQWYEYTGVLGGSLWVLLVNLLVFEAWKRRRDFRAWIAPGIAFALPAAVSLAMYASYREDISLGSTTVAIVQPNVDPYKEKFKLTSERRSEMLVELMEQAPENVDFIVTPETAIDERYMEHRLLHAPSVDRIRTFVREQRPEATVVVGSLTYRPYESEETASPTARHSGSLWYDVYNSALSLDSTERIGIHHKAKLVIGVEMIPYYPLVKKLKFLVTDLGGISGQLGYGDVREVFVSPSGIAAGPAICYEAIYGEYFTEFVRNGAQVMFVISNDGWWRDTPGHRYLFAYSRLRAIETRRSIARSANTGQSGFIDQRGDVTETMLWAERGVRTATLNLNDRQTFYVRHGDAIGRIGGYVFILSLLYFTAYRFRKRSHLVE